MKWIISCYLASGASSISTNHNISAAWLSSNICCWFDGIALAESFDVTCDIDLLVAIFFFSSFSFRPSAGDTILKDFYAPPLLLWVSRGNEEVTHFPVCYRFSRSDSNFFSPFHMRFILISEWTIFNEPNIVSLEWEAGHHSKDIWRWAKRMRNGCLIAINRCFRTRYSESQNRYVRTRLFLLLLEPSLDFLKLVLIVFNQLSTH